MTPDSPLSPKTWLADAVPGAFPLFASGQTATIYHAAEDHPVVAVAARHLAQDLGAVCGAAIVPVGNQPPECPEPCVVIGTLGNCAWLDRLAAEGTLPELAALAGRWEGYPERSSATRRKGWRKPGMVVGRSEETGTKSQRNSGSWCRSRRMSCGFRSRTHGCAHA